MTYSGEPLVDFHHRLFEVDGYIVEHKDFTEWFRHFGKPSDYYYPFLLHHVAHGVWFDNPFTADERDNAFSNNAVLPSIYKITDKYGVKPLIVRMYPDEETQTEEDDFYYWCYPPRVNDYLMKYANDHGLAIREIKHASK